MGKKGSPYLKNPANARRFAGLQDRLKQPMRISGERIRELVLLMDLHSTEIGYMLGLNNSALYRKQGHNDTLNAGVSILMRNYASMPELVERRVPPKPSELMEKIASIDPEIRPHHLNVILGLERSASQRLRDSLDENVSQVVRVLSLMIWKKINEDPDSWFIIKQNIENEAEARGIIPGFTIWETLGGWGDHAGNGRATRAKKEDENKE